MNAREQEAIDRINDILLAPGEVETPCATCHGERTILSAHWGNAPVSRIPCPDCGVETPEAAVEAGADALARWLGADDLNAEYQPAVAWHVAHLYDGAKRVLDAAKPHFIAQGWTPPGGTE